MKLSIGIFNAILVFMVILILHFVIIKFGVKKESFVINTERCEPTNKVSISKNLETEKENMLKFVMNDNNLDQFFKDKPVTSVVVDDTCKSRIDKNHIPLSTTCDTKLLDSEFKTEMKVIGDCKLPQDKKHYTMLKTYDEENSMSGSPVFANINAYDNEDFNFSSY